MMNMVCLFSGVRRNHYETVLLIKTLKLTVFVYESSQAVEHSNIHAIFIIQPCLLIFNRNKHLSKKQISVCVTINIVLVKL